MHKTYSLIILILVSLSCNNRQGVENSSHFEHVEETKDSLGSFYSDEVKFDSLTFTNIAESSVEINIDSLSLLLIYAINSCDYKKSEELLESKANPNYFDNSYQFKTALIIAVKNCSVQMVELLLNYGADPDLKVYGEVGMYGPVEQAVLSCKEDVLKMFIDANSESLTDAMAVAFSYSDEAIVKMLMENGVPVDKDYLISTRSAELVKLCLEHGANPNYYGVCNEGLPIFPKLFEAVGRGDTLMIRYLIDAGANPNLALSEYDILKEGSKEKKSPILVAEQFLKVKREQNYKDTTTYLQIIHTLKESGRFISNN
ncbi:ankyrin repeat domain-containing protein [Carboxylicivirga sp. N1Y90]|uniref:ankyrin repeat domain-containing protein n=1 Tax=Carboxylicivirga fragile TaxID=3417571 RepID=UPI003D34FBA0|nr:ankyrin repeat domain-containing protein [Marinilabiliaceae bacterium N1Y90]